jgi:hypothetical protein
VDASGATQVIDIASMVKAAETVTTLAADAQAVYTYTNEKGDKVSIDIPADVANNFQEIIDNTSVQTILNDYIINNVQGNVSYDAANNTFTYVDASGATQVIDIASMVKASETLTSLSLTDTKLTYNDEKGTANEIDLSSLIANEIAYNETVTTLQLVGKKLVYHNEDGNNPDVDLSSLTEAAWNIAGNDGTSAETNFVGTTDDVDLAFRTNNTEKMRISSYGNVGIANASPQYTLDVIGDAKVSNNIYCASIFTTSDARLKKDIKNINNGLKTISLLRPVSYVKKTTMNSKDYTIKETGFIAQEVRKVLPDLVTEMNDADKTLIVNYNAVIPILTKAVQEQQVQIEAQQKQIDMLIKALENKK